MSSSEFVAIHPDNVRAAAAHLRTRASLSDDIEIDLRRAGMASELDIAAALGACAEIREELSLLATVLTTRADLAEGFRLPGGDWSLTSMLMASLLDDRGARARLSAPLALEILMTQGRHAASDGANPTTTDDPLDALVFTVADLLALAADPSSSPELAAAATFLAAHSEVVATTRAWEGTGAWLPSHHPGEIPLRDIEAFIARNEALRLLTGPGGAVSSSDLHADLDDTTIEAAGIDPRAFDSLGLPRNGHDLLVATIHHGTHDHSPLSARAFVETLPVHYLDGHSLDVTALDPAAVERLHDTATADLGTSQADFATRCKVVAHLPETTAGIRNELITDAYAEIAHWHNALVNGDTPATADDFGGNNWFHLGVAASSSLHQVITGHRRVLEVGGVGLFAIPDPVVQDIADGNQAIFHHFSSELDRHWSGEPTASPRMDLALDLIHQAAAEGDPVERQLLIAESTVLLAIEEQIIVDPYLQLDGLSLVEQIGTFGLTALLLDPRTSGQVMTDEGDLRFQANGNDLLAPVVIGAPVPPPANANHRVDPAVLADRLPDDFDWHATQADDWSELAQRIPIIEDVALLTLTEPALATMVDHHRDELLDGPS